MRFGGAIPFTIYADNSIGIDYDPNVYPYLDTSFFYELWDSSRYANDTRIESSTIYYSNTIYCSTSNTDPSNWNGKLDADTNLEQRTLTLPSYFLQQPNQGYKELKNRVPAANLIDDYVNDKVITYNEMISVMDPSITNVFINKRKKSVSIEINQDFFNEINYDIVFITKGTANLNQNFWIDKTGRFGIISFNNINMNPTNYSDKMGGNIFLYAYNDINFLAESESGSNIIVGKILAKNDIILDGTDYWENTSGDDFDYISTDGSLQGLHGLNITDNPNIFTSPRPLPFNIEYGGGGGITSQRIWRQR
jgi:hypothetical protein